MSNCLVYRLSRANAHRLLYACVLASALGILFSLVLLAIAWRYVFSYGPFLALLGSGHTLSFPVIFGICSVLSFFCHAVGFFVCWSHTFVTLPEQYTRSMNRYLLLHRSMLLFQLAFLVAAAIVNALALSELTHEFEKGFQPAMNSYSSSPQVRRTLNDLQYRYSCCGNSDYRDWFYTRWFEDDSRAPKIFREEPLLNGTKRALYLQVAPFSCCDLKMSTPCAHKNALRERYRANGHHERETDEVSLHRQGCLSRFRSRFARYLRTSTVLPLAVLFCLSFVVIPLVNVAAMSNIYKIRRHSPWKISYLTEAEKIPRTYATQSRDESSAAWNRETPPVPSDSRSETADEVLSYQDSAQDREIGSKSKTSISSNASLDLKERSGSNASLNLKESSGSNASSNLKESSGSNASLNVKESSGSNASLNLKESSGSNASLNVKESSGSNASLGSQARVTSVSGSVETSDESPWESRVSSTEGSDEPGIRERSEDSQGLKRIRPYLSTPPSEEVVPKRAKLSHSKRPLESKALPQGEMPSDVGIGAEERSVESLRDVEKEEEEESSPSLARRLEDSESEIKIDGESEKSLKESLRVVEEEGESSTCTCRLKISEIENTTLDPHEHPTSSEDSHSGELLEKGESRDSFSLEPSVERLEAVESQDVSVRSTDESPLAPSSLPPLTPPTPPRRSSESKDSSSLESTTRDRQSAHPLDESKKDGLGLANANASNISRPSGGSRRNDLSPLKSLSPGTPRVKKTPGRDCNFDLAHSRKAAATLAPAISTRKGFGHPKAGDFDYPQRRLVPSSLEGISGIHISSTLSNHNNKRQGSRTSVVDINSSGVLGIPKSFSSREKRVSFPSGSVPIPESKDSDCSLFCEDVLETFYGFRRLPKPDNRPHYKKFTFVPSS